MVVLTATAFVLNGCKGKGAPKAKEPVQEAVEEVKAAYPSLNPDEFEQAIAEEREVLVLDVRSKSEYEAGHIENAVNMNANLGVFRKESAQLPKGKRIAIYCRVGIRSKSVAQILMEEGFDVVHLENGFEAWHKAGKNIVK